MGTNSMGTNSMGANSMGTNSMGRTIDQPENVLISGCYSCNTII